MEEAHSDETIFDFCCFEEPLIGLAFYDSDIVNFAVKYEGKHQQFENASGLALSFYACEKVEFIYTISASRPSECIVVVITIRILRNLSELEAELYSEFLHQLVHAA